VTWLQTRFHTILVRRRLYIVLDKAKAALAPAGSNPQLAGQVASQAGVNASGSPTWLSLKAYHVLALVKLRTYGAAADELKLLGNLAGLYPRIVNQES